MTTHLKDVLIDEVTVLHQMLVELGASDGVTQIRTTVESLGGSIHAPEPAVFAKLIWHQQSIAGFVIYSWKWGTFTGVLDMYLHAIFVRPEYRRQGIANR